MNNVHKSRQGGKRKGAGRPKGINRYGEATQPLRVPKSLVPLICQSLDDYSAYRRAADFKILGKYEPTHLKVELPLYASKIQAGFPSPADDYIESVLDLNDLLILEPDATFLAKVSGDSMIDAGIEIGDIIVIDKSIEPKHKNIVVAAIDNVFTVKRLYKRAGKIKLIAENKTYEDIELANLEELVIWGVVTSCIKQFS